MTGQNGIVRRLLFLAIGLSALLWAASARPSAVEPAGVMAISGVESCQLTADTDGPSQADLKWRAQLHTIGIVTESIWKSALVHVELGATRAACSVETVLAFSSPDPPLSSVPHYLRHTPLLI